MGSRSQLFKPIRNHLKAKADVAEPGVGAEDAVVEDAEADVVAKRPRVKGKAKAVRRFGVGLGSRSQLLKPIRNHLNAKADVAEPGVGVEGAVVEGAQADVVLPKAAASGDEVARQHVKV